jgi:putative ABC transport system permease protein
MLALGIGSATAIFSVVNVVLLQSSYSEPERLFVLEELAPDLAARFPTSAIPVNGRHFDEWRKTCTVCESFGLMQLSGGANLVSDDGPPERVRALGVSHDFLQTLGVAPALGRTILPADDVPGAPSVILLSDGFWRRRFAADAGIVGRDILLNGETVTIIGVLPAGFEPVGGDYMGVFGSTNQAPDALRPARIDYAGMPPVGNHNYGAIVRLKPGATPVQAALEMDAAIRPLVEEFRRETSVQLRPVDEAVLGDSADGLWMLLAAVGGVLLIVCVNVANLMFVRVERRGKEAAVRRALGASNFRLIVDVFREGFVLSLVGGLGGLLVAQWAIAGIVLAAPVDLPRLGAVAIDWRVLFFALAATLTSALLISALPGLRQRSISATLSGSRATEAAPHRRASSRSVLVAVETGLSAVLVIIAALLGSSLFRLLSVDRGFSGQNVLSFDIVLPPQTYPSEGGARQRFQDALLEKLRAHPGVLAAGFSTKLPLEGAVWAETLSAADAVEEEQDRLLANYRFTSPGYWQAMGIALIDGRFLDDADDASRIVISESAARQIWPGQSAIGKQVVRGSADQIFEVVGVVSDVKATGLNEADVPIAYLSYDVVPLDGVSYALRASANPHAMADAVRQAVWSIDETLPVTNFRTMAEVVDRSTAEERFQTMLAGIFSAAALLLAALGIYGVVSYSVVKRTKEIGLRMAVGAEAHRIVTMVLGQGIKPILFGLGGGLIGALATARLIESLLFGVSANDPMVLAGAILVLGAAGLAACYVPARRAARIDPMRALKYE